MNEINNSLEELVLLRTKIDKDSNQILEYQYRYPPTGEIQYYTVTVQKAQEIMLTEKIRSKTEIGTEIIACSDGQYCIINRAEHSEHLLLIPFSIKEGNTQETEQRKEN